ncbi:NUDIX hydrolase [Paenibacillus oceani]|nr:NUDIX hydrolase [Paenibacillus oceani]
MTERFMQSLHVGAVTDHQPFCAGVVWVRDGKVAITLNTDGIPDALEGRVMRVGGVGGGQEPGETIAECALREAQEELGNPNVRLLSSTATYFHNMDTDEVVQVPCIDETPPFLLQRITSSNPDEPYKPGLPTGPYVYFGLYRAETDEARINPDDDVAAILFVPVERWPVLEQSATLGQMMELGCELLERAPIPRELRLWVPENESMRTVMRLLFPPD